MKGSSIIPRHGTLNRLLQEITTEEQSRTDTKMQLAAKIAESMETKGWDNEMLMMAMNMCDTSEISIWLSGTHNFTVDTLINLERVLKTRFLNV